MMARCGMIIQIETEKAVASYVGYHMTNGVKDVELDDQNDKGWRWVTAVCEKLKTEYDNLEKQELEWLAQGYISQLLYAMYPGYHFDVRTRVDQFAENYIKIRFIEECYE